MLGELLLVALVGALAGCLTGLLPSLHVNTLAVLLLALAPLLSHALPALGLGAFPPAFYLAAFILAVSIAHTYVNAIPATFLGAPDESNALSVLPAHKMLLRGTGYRAVELSALSSQWAVLASLALAFPFKWLLGEPVGLFEWVRSHLFWLVLVLAVALVVTEPAGLGPDAWPAARRRLLARAVAVALLLATSIYGLLINRIPYQSLAPIPPSPLLPALSGMFGAATILAALTLPPKLPHQFLLSRHQDLTLGGGAAALGAGLAAGATMSVLPGLTNASASALATVLRKGTDEETIVNLSAVNTANAVFNLAVLYLYLRTRSGAVVAMAELVPVVAWTGRIPTDLAWFGFIAAVSGTAALLLTLLLGRLLARRIHVLPYRGLLLGVLVYMTLTVAVFNGPGGILSFATATAIGLVPVRLGLRRTALTGVLLGPVLVYLAPLAEP